MQFANDGKFNLQNLMDSQLGNYLEYYQSDEDDDS